MVQFLKVGYEIFFIKLSYGGYIKQAIIAPDV
jgi:hypothetical protein